MAFSASVFQAVPQGSVLGPLFPSAIINIHGFKVKDYLNSQCSLLHSVCKSQQTDEGG